MTKTRIVPKVSLERITLNPIESFDVSDLEALGEAVIKISPWSWRPNNLVLSHDYEKRVIQVSWNDGWPSRSEFLSFVDDYLKKERMYLSNIQYKEGSSTRDSKLRGNLYHQKS